MEIDRKYRFLRFRACWVNYRPWVKMTRSRSEKESDCWISSVYLVKDKGGGRQYCLSSRGRTLLSFSQRKLAVSCHFPMDRTEELCGIHPTTQVRLPQRFRRGSGRGFGWKPPLSSRPAPHVTRILRFSRHSRWGCFGSIWSASILWPVGFR